MNTTTRTPPSQRQVPANALADALLFMGIGLAILGIIAIAASFIATLSSVVLLGGLLIVASIVEFIHVAKERGASRTVVPRVISAILYLVVGIALLWNPLAGALGLTLLIAAFLIVAGIVRLANAFTHRNNNQWGWGVFSGILDLVLGAIIGLGWPWTGLWVIGTFVGIELLFNGVADIFLGMGLRESPQGSLPLGQH